ncbi:hypothetical protein ACO0QE_002543 [Hanseniaspora vineae]
MSNLYINTNTSSNNQGYPPYMPHGTFHTSTTIPSSPLTPNTLTPNTLTPNSPSYGNMLYSMNNNLQVIDSNEFSPEQKQAIIQHLMITKSSIPVKLYPHVPCKFYQQGMCQAGVNCPFSHDLNACKKRQVCKYFQRGHCKFGAKCCNVHPISSEASHAFGNYTHSTVTTPSNNSNAHTINQTKKNLSPRKQDHFLPFDMDEEGEGGKGEGEGEGEGEGNNDEYLEYIPGELSELLTPLELAHKRRSSEQSNRSRSFERGFHAC